MRALISFLFVAAAVGCKSELPPTAAPMNYDQAEMDQAIARARSEVDAFITKFEAGAGTDFSVKAPIEGGGETEHFWLTDISYTDGKFTGTIGNEPGLVKTVTFGQPWTLGKTEISDWMYMKDGKIHGNYTVRPLLKTFPKEQADQVRSMLADP